MIKKILITIICFFIATASYATDYYVSTIGNDTYDGLASTYVSGTNGPWLTIQHSADTAIAGDIVTVLDGTYDQAGTSVRFRNKGTSENPITFQAQNQHGAVVTSNLTGDDAVFTIGTYSGDWIPYEDFYLVLDGFDISGGDAHCIQSAGGAHVTIKNCQLHGSGNDPIKMNSGADYAWVHHNWIYNSGAGCDLGVECNADGIDITSSYNVLIEDNEIGPDIKSTGLYIKKGSHNAVVRRNYIHDTGDGGISLGQSSPLYTSVAYNNIVVDAGCSGFAMFGCKDCKIYNNTGYNINTTNVTGGNSGLRASAAQNRYGAEVLIEFSSGGTYELQENDIVVGDTTGDEGYVYGLVTESGTWAAGDASGYFYIKEGWDDDYWSDETGTISVLDGQSNVCTIDSVTVDDKYVSNAVFKNNLIVLGGSVYYGFRLGSNHTIADISVDNNLYYSTYGSDPILFDADGYGDRVLSVWISETLSAGYPQSANAVEGNPDFISIDSENDNFLKLLASSPALNAGTALSEISSLFTTDYSGVTRGDPVEIGAYEYSGSYLDLPDNFASTSPASFNGTGASDQNITGITASTGTVTINSGLGTTAVDFDVDNITVPEEGVTVTVTMTLADASTIQDSVAITLQQSATITTIGGCTLSGASIENAP